jgi:pimeloyl-ACP methyl ester carboxylesterase
MAEVVEDLPVATQLEHMEMAAKVAGMELPELVIPEDRTVKANGLTFHYLDWGNAGARPLLFLHGAGLTAHTWDLCCLALRSRFHCMALDLRGHGDTDWAPDGNYGADAHAADAAGVVEALGLNDFVLVGMSMGGNTALHFAGKHAAKLRALVIIDTGPQISGRGGQRIRDFMAGPAELGSLEDFVDRAVEFNPARDRRLLRRSLLHNLRQLPDGKWTWKYDRGGMMQRDPSRMQAMRDALWAALPGITCPTLVVRGGRSDLFMDEDAEKLATSVPNGRWVRVENAGHTVQGDNPKGLVDALNGFFAEVGI